MNRHVRLYQALLMLYPRAFRREYARDLTQSFVDLARDRGTASTWIRCWVDLAVTVPRYQLEALVHRHVSSASLIALPVAVVGLAGVAGLVLGGVVALPLLAVAAIVAASQRTALAKSLVVPPGQRRARLRTASLLTLICIAAVGSWMYHVDRYDDLAGTTVLVHNLIGILSLLGAAGFGLAGLLTRTEMPHPTGAR